MPNIAAENAKTITPIQMGLGWVFSCESLGAKAVPSASARIVAQAEGGLIQINGERGRQRGSVFARSLLARAKYR